jgi:lysophospholipase L1-like esterase
MIFLITALVLFVADRILGAAGFPPNPEIQVTHPPNLKQHRVNIEFEYDFVTNDKGLRYEEIPEQKLDGETRVFVVGDSFTEGIGVEANERFTSFLELYFTSMAGEPVRFINGGLSGRNPLAYWRLFLRVGRAYDLDGLLVCINENDVSETLEEITPDDLYRKYRAEQRSGVKAFLHRVYPRIYMLINMARAPFQLKNSAPHDFLETVTGLASARGIAPERIQEWKESLPAELVNAVNRGEFNRALLAYPLLHPYLKTDSIDIDTPRAEQKYQAMLAPLEEMLLLARQEGIRVGIVYIPSRLQYEPHSHDLTNPLVRAGMDVRKRWLSGRSEAQSRIARWCEVRKVPCLDLLAVLREKSEMEDALTYEMDGHWNSNGHRIAGAAISTWIEESNVFFSNGEVEPSANRVTMHPDFY